MVFCFDIHVTKARAIQRRAKRTGCVWTTVGRVSFLAKSVTRMREYLGQYTYFDIHFASRHRGIQCETDNDQFTQQANSKRNKISNRNKPHGTESQRFMHTEVVTIWNGLFFIASVGGNPLWCLFVALAYTAFCCYFWISKLLIWFWAIFCHRSSFTPPNRWWWPVARLDWQNLRFNQKSNSFARFAFK